MNELTHSPPRALIREIPPTANELLLTTINASGTVREQVNVQEDSCLSTLRKVAQRFINVLHEIRKSADHGLTASALFGHGKFNPQFMRLQLGFIALREETEKTGTVTRNQLARLLDMYLTTYEQPLRELIMPYIMNDILGYKLLLDRDRQGVKTPITLGQLTESAGVSDFAKQMGQPVTGRMRCKLSNLLDEELVMLIGRTLEEQLKGKNIFAFLDSPDELDAIVQTTARTISDAVITAAEDASYGIDHDENTEFGVSERTSCFLRIIQEHCDLPQEIRAWITRLHTENPLSTDIPLPDGDALELLHRKLIAMLGLKGFLYAQTHREEDGGREHARQVQTQREFFVNAFYDVLLNPAHNIATLQLAMGTMLIASDEYELRAMLFGVTQINPTLRQELGLTDQDYGSGAKQKIENYTRTLIERNFAAPPKKLLPPDEGTAK